MQALDELGCADDMVARGIKGRGSCMNSREQQLALFDFTTALTGHTKYPFILILPQRDTEEVLHSHLVKLGGHVHRPMRAASMKKSSEDGQIEVTFENGQVIRTKYVVGADGAQSIVRDLPACISQPQHSH